MISRLMILSCLLIILSAARGINGLNDQSPDSAPDYCRTNGECTRRGLPLLPPKPARTLTARQGSTSPLFGVEKRGEQWVEMDGFESQPKYRTAIIQIIDGGDVVSYVGSDVSGYATVSYTTIKWGD